MGRERGIGGEWGKIGKRNERDKQREREKESEKARRDDNGGGDGEFALKFKYHSRGRAFTLRSVERSGPI